MGVLEYLDFLKSSFINVLNAFKPKSKLRFEIVHTSANTFPTVFSEEYDPFTEEVIDRDIGYTTNFEVRLKIWNKGDNDTSIEQIFLYVYSKKGKITCKPRHGINEQIKSIHPPKEYKLLFNAGKYYFSDKDNPIILRIKDMRTFYSIYKKIYVKDHTVDEEFG